MAITFPTPKPGDIITSSGEKIANNGNSQIVTRERAARAYFGFEPGVDNIPTQQVNDLYQKVTAALAIRRPHWTIDEYSKRTYDAAIPTGATADWLAWSTSGSYEALHGWRRICYLARDLERNNPHAIAFLRDLTTNVLGSKGIIMKAKVKNLKGDNFNEKLNDKITDIWTRWNKKGNCDVTGQYSGILADNLVLRALARDGGCLIRLYRGYPNRYRFAFQLLEIDALDLWYNVILDSGHRVTTGVETDLMGKPIAYHLLKYAQSDLMANNTVGQRIRVPASDIIHVWLPNRITEVRGVSWLAPVMVKMRMLDKFEEAAAIGKRITAAKMGFFETAADAQTYKGQGNTSTGEVINEVSPGMLESLPTGVTFKPFDPGKTEDTYKDFKKDILRTIASGLGDQYNALANDLESVNYSSARFGRDITIEFWRGIQHFYIETVKQPLVNALLECASMNGDIDISFQSNNGDRLTAMDKVQESIIWRPRGWRNVDPEKDSTGSIQDVWAGFSTKSRELAESGQDIEEVYEELAYEEELAKKYNLTFIDPTGRNPNMITQEDPEAGPGEAGAAGSGGTTAKTGGQVPSVPKIKKTGGKQPPIRK